MSDPLSPDERLRLDSLFDRAADLPLAEHASFLDRECGSNAALRGELARLLAGLAGEDLLGQTRFTALSLEGTRIGPYELQEKIGEGGMGEVYAAEQRGPVARRVALKVIKAGMDSSQVIARFEAERQALARMSHPAIAQVFDGGTSDAGRPYFVMEYVRGEPISEYCDRRTLSTRARIELFLGVCEGVQHAHQKGVVHRDLKPSNILVTRQEDRALPKIIDFGVARATTGRLAENSLQTLLGQVVGTLAYMSPEQADPTGVDVDTRSDIYSLGVVLYQLLSGLLPFEHSLTGGVQLAELQRAIREDEPPTPSVRLRRERDTASSIAPLHGTDERSLVRQLGGDLDWICLKAIEKDPGRRYASASELSADLRRHLAHEPVLARRPGVLYRARKFVRRNRLAVAAGAAALAAAGVAAAGIVLGQREADWSDRIARAAIDAERVVGLEVETSELWPPLPGRIEDMEYWLSRAGDLVGQLPEHRALLAALREDALAIEPAAGEWRFGEPGLQRQHDAIEKAIAGAKRLRAGLLAEDAITAEHSWSVPKRIAFARRMQAGFAVGGEYAAAWAAHPDLELEPQIGLVPLGRDPVSQLWEFAHLMTGETPARDDSRELILTEDTALVLVLIPGGTFMMGTETEDPYHRGHAVELSAYFISKYEMTQGQWGRLTGHDPSAYGARPGQEWRSAWRETGDEGSLLHPVEQVSWQDCDTWLRRAGLQLPSEAQWEHAARAGTETAFSTDSDQPASLLGAANLRDQHFKNEAFEMWGRYQRDYDDGSTVHWEVGSGRPNRFGLHDVHGNVLEWCLDPYAPYPEPAPDGSATQDPVPAPSSDLRHSYRGGSFRHLSAAARSFARSFDPPTFFGSARGVRPGRRITPGP